MTGASSSTAGARAHGSAAGTSGVAGLRSSRSAIASTPPSPRSSRPAFLDRRTDAWAIADRVAWGELDAGDIPVVKHLPALLAAVRPVAASSQLIHGDLTGNVLFADGLAPAIIDLSPYWRPPSFASAVVVADALVWEGADERLLRAWTNGADFTQYLLRALIYRAVADRLARLDEPLRQDDADPFLPVVELALRAAADSLLLLRRGDAFGQ